MSKKELLSKYLTLSGINRAYRFFTRNDITVLMYHGVVKDEWDNADGNWLQVRESEFRAQMEHLKEHYEVVPFHTPFRSGSGKKPRAIITFDDGYANNYSVAYPILKEFGVAATIFLVTDLVDTNKIMWYDRLYLALKDKFSDSNLDKLITSFKSIHPHDIDKHVDRYLKDVADDDFLEPSNEDLQSYGYLATREIREMEDSGLIDFGSHTHGHEIATELSNDEFADSVAVSLRKLRDLVHNTSPIFCFPNGWYEQRHIDILIQYYDEILGSVTTENGKWNRIDDDPYHIPRIGVGRGTTSIHFGILASGLWSVIINMLRKG